MKRILIFFVCLAALFPLAACSHRYTEEEYRTVLSELDASRKQHLECQAQQERLQGELREALTKLDKAGADTTAACGDRQSLLDRNIECLEENRALLKQIARFRVISQEQKDASRRLTNATEYLSAFLKAERMNDQVYIVKAETQVKIIIPQRALFPTPASAWLMPRGSALLKKVAMGLEQLKPLTVNIAGHTDDAPLPRQALKTYPTQWDLSAARAISVLSALEEYGISRDKLSVSSYAGTRPIAAETSEEGRAMNRRVEILVTP
ncbi:MAG TPA: OmpA family protein [Deltaproteobacteria bacterium]|nr:OmpA family protein [Deltaproteobacteria bacterium]HQI82102.1 OmpA family protein [Deltaproteobacteria bacterium]